MIISLDSGDLLFVSDAKQSQYHALPLCKHAIIDSNHTINWGKYRLQYLFKIVLVCVQSLSRFCSSSLHVCTVTVTVCSLCSCVHVTVSSIWSDLAGSRSEYTRACIHSIWEEAERPDQMLYVIYTVCIILDLGRHISCQLYIGWPDSSIQLAS